MFTFKDMAVKVVDAMLHPRTCSASMVGAAMKVNKFGQPKENRKTSDTNS
jgi:hypothetical protein